MDDVRSCYCLGIFFTFVFKVPLSQDLGSSVGGKLSPSSRDPGSRAGTSLESLMNEMN